MTAHGGASTGHQINDYSQHSAVPRPPFQSRLEDLSRSNNERLAEWQRKKQEEEEAEWQRTHTFKPQLVRGRSVSPRLLHRSAKYMMFPQVAKPPAAVSNEIRVRQGKKASDRLFQDANQREVSSTRGDSRASARPVRADTAHLLLPLPPRQRGWRSPQLYKMRN